MHSVKSFYKKISENRLIKALGPFSVLIVIILIFSILTPTFRTLGNLTSVGLSASVYVILAMGMTFVIISGGIDLSLGSIVGLAGAFCCILLQNADACVGRGAGGNAHGYDVRRHQWVYGDLDGAAAFHRHAGRAMDIPRPAAGNVWRRHCYGAF